MKAIYIADKPLDRRPADLTRAPLDTAMTAPAVCIAADRTLGEALRAMVGAGRRHLVVVDAEGRCVGVLADRAVAAAWATSPDSLSSTTVQYALDTPPAILRRHVTLRQAARMMRQLGVDAVAVVQADGRPVGILTGSDLVGLLAG